MQTSSRARVRRAFTTLTGLAALLGASGAVVAATAAATPVTAAAPASEWTQVRGSAAHTGFNSAETTITKGNVANLTLANTIVDVGDEGINAETLVAGGKFYVLSTQVFDPSTVIRAFDASTGQKLWSGGPGQTSIGTAAAIAGGKLFLLTDSPNSTVFAMDANTGAFLWKTAIGCGQSIAAEGSVVAVSHSCDVFPTVVFLNANTGAKTGEGCEGDPDAEGYAGPTLRSGVAFFVSNDTQSCKPSGADNGAWTGAAFIGDKPTLSAALSAAVYGAGEDILRASNGTNGSTIWKVAPLASEGSWKVLGMSVDGSRIYLAVRTQGGAGRLIAFNRNNGSRAWTKSINVRTAPAVANGVVFTSEGSDGIAAYNANTGAKLWSKPGRADSAPPVVAGGRLYVGWTSSSGPTPAPLAIFKLG